MKACLENLSNQYASAQWSPRIIVYLLILYFYILTHPTPLICWLPRCPLHHGSGPPLLWISIFRSLFWCVYNWAPGFVLSVFGFSVLGYRFWLMFLIIFILGSYCLEHSAFTLVTIEWDHLPPRVTVMRAWSGPSPPPLGGVSFKACF